VVSEEQTNPSQPVRKKRSLIFRIVFGQNPKRTAVRAVILIVTALVTFGFVLWPVRIVGISMEPTYRDKGIASFNFVNRLAYRWSRPKRGDVVALRFSEMRIRPIYMKRIIALPGETVDIRDGIVFIDEAPLDEPYVKSRWRWNIPPRTLGTDEYFLIGDNRGMRPRDHSFGVKTADEILGKALW
jgi:signal peptidase I